MIESLEQEAARYVHRLKSRIEREPARPLFILYKPGENKKHKDYFHSKGRRATPLFTSDPARAGAFEHFIARVFGRFYGLQIEPAPAAVFKRVAQEEIEHLVRMGRAKSLPGSRTMEGLAQPAKGPGQTGTPRKWRRESA